jgi:Asp-tRNA(Asn)/Glu-tRNA(Gln) amidotransferase A subunit family amidase
MSGPAIYSAQFIADGVRTGKLDPVELVERAVQRAKVAAPLGAIVHIDETGARRTAKSVARNREGALAGVPILVKEIIAVDGMPFRCGSRVFAERVATSDAQIVRRARQAGAVIIGLSHTHEFAYGCTGVSNMEGPCRNPHDPTRITGGSSAGSAAAVAAGVVPLALGTDTAGSVRIPAALCGVVGSKPARHTLPVHGVFPLSTSLDHTGVLTRSVSDARFATGVLSGYPSSITLPTAPLLGVLTNPEPLDCSAEVYDAYLSCVDRLATAGAILTEITMPEWSRIAEIGPDIQGPEAAAVHADMIVAQCQDYQPDVLERLRAAAEIPGWRYVRALEQAAALTDEVDRLLQCVDAVLLPTVPIVASPLEALDAAVASGRYPVRDLLLRNNRLANITGHPALSLPIPAASELPVGLQVIASDNDRAFAAAEWIENVVNDGKG